MLDLWPMIGCFDEISVLVAGRAWGRPRGPARLIWALLVDLVLRS
jgi:hypothetical protein